MKKIIFFIGLTLLLLTSVDNGDAEASFCDLKTYVFYGNGMFNEQSSAESGLRKLKRKLISGLKK